jgi:hypothetical protein
LTAVISEIDISYAQFRAFGDNIMTDDLILTEEHILDIRSAHSAIMDEVDAMKRSSPGQRDFSEFGPPGYYRSRLAELCPADALDAYDRFLKDRREAAKRIDPLTCNWYVTFTDCTDPYCITGHCGCVGRDFAVWDDNSEGEIESHDLSPEQYGALRERIEREAKKPVLSSFSITPAGVQMMPMPSSSDPERVTEQEISLEECLKIHREPGDHQQEGS